MFALSTGRTAIAIGRTGPSRGFRTYICTSMRFDRFLPRSRVVTGVSGECTLMLRFDKKYGTELQGA